jgi:hypothetical protein
MKKKKDDDDPHFPSFFVKFGGGALERWKMGRFN